MTATAWPTPPQRATRVMHGNAMSRATFIEEVAAAEDAAFEQIALHFDESEQHATADRVRRFAQRRRESR